MPDTEVEKPGLKSISKDAVPRALELAERYRLLNEPEQAESICRDVLTVDHANQEAMRTLMLAMTEQFGRSRSITVQSVEEVCAMMEDPYERIYYTGVAYERWGRAKLHEAHHTNMGLSWIRHAMDRYQEAEKIRPAGNDAALLRWNTCVRLMEHIPGAHEERHEVHYGD